MSNTTKPDNQGQSDSERINSNQGKAPAFADDKGKPEVTASIIRVPLAEERRK